MQLGVLVTIVARLFAVIAHNVRKILGALWHLLASWARCSGIGTANGCSHTLGVGYLFAILRCIMLLSLLNPVIVGPSLSFVLVERDVVNSAALPALSFLGLEGFQFYYELLELVPGVR